MKEILEKVGRQEIISLYDDKNSTTAFYCGKVYAMNEIHVLLEHFDSIGRYSGYVILKNENIFRVNRNGQYENAVSALEKALPEKHNLTARPSTLVSDLMDYAKKEGLVVLIELCESALDNIQGVIIEFNDEVITLDCVDDYGVPDGRSTIFFEDVSAIKCDTTFCQGIKALMGLRES